MNSEVTHYSRESLQKLLEDALPEPLAGEVAEHLTACPDCRRQWEVLSGQTDWWSHASRDVKRILTHSSEYSSTIGSNKGSLFEDCSTPPVDDDVFASDFAVDFLAASDDPAMLGRLGEYDILEVIGRGGMGIVFKGFERGLHRCVAVKVMAPHLALSVAARRRFEREAQATAAVVHPHVMAIHTVDANAKLPYLVMPYVTCESLQQRLDRQGPQDVKDVLRIGMQAANGLAAAHAQGLVHRDVKPANILLETNVDRVMLTDFGLARAVDDATLTRTGIIAGTPLYMSPEQANGDVIDPRSDLFSLGSVLYAMCTGRPPFRADTTFGVLRRIREVAPRPIREINSDIPGWLECFVMKLLAKAPAERFSSAREVASLLERCLAHVQQPTTLPLPAPIADWPEDPVRVESPASSKSRYIDRIKRGPAIVLTMAVGVISVTSWSLLTRPATEPLQSRITPTPTPQEETTPVSKLPIDPRERWDAIQDDLDAISDTLQQLESPAEPQMPVLNAIRDAAN